MSERDDLLYHVFKDVTFEDIERTRKRWKQDGFLKTIETPFGSIDILVHPGLPDNEIRIGPNKIIIDDD